MVSDGQPDAREGQAGRPGVAERFVVPRKPANAGGGKGPQFKTDATRGEGPGDWATYQLRRVFRNCRRRCTRKRRQKPAIASTPCTTRSAARKTHHRRNRLHRRRISHHGLVACGSRFLVACRSVGSESHQGKAVIKGESDEHCRWFVQPAAERQASDGKACPDRGEKASEALRQKQKADAEKKALIDKLLKPSGISEEDALNRASAIIERAIKNGLTEVEVLRFPNALCTDHGRAINNNLEPGWEDTLTGLPKEMYRFWNDTCDRSATGLLPKPFEHQRRPDAADRDLDRGIIGRRAQHHGLGRKPRTRAHQPLQADLPQARRDHPRSCVLQLPRAGAEEGPRITARPVRVWPKRLATGASDPADRSTTPRLSRAAAGAVLSCRLHAACTARRDRRSYIWLRALCPGGSN